MLSYPLRNQKGADLGNTQLRLTNQRRLPHILLTISSEGKDGWSPNQKSTRGKYSGIEKNEGNFFELYWKLGHGPKRFFIRRFELSEGQEGVKLFLKGKDSCWMVGLKPWKNEGTVKRPEGDSDRIFDQ